MTTTQEAPTRNGQYIDIDGVHTYYEVTGTGDPVVLLHGGLCTAETFDAQTGALAEQYRVFVPERFGHGRTPDLDGPITYDNMTDHTIGFIEALGIGPVHLGGWSDGALIGLLVARRRPDLVRKLVFIDQYVTLEGAPAWYLPFMQELTPESAPPPMVELYKAFSPDGPDHFPVVFEKLQRLWTSPTGVEIGDLAEVATPTLVLAGDEGGITFEHLAEIHHALPDCQVAVVPGTSHGVALEKPHVVNQLIVDFLADEQAPKLF